jgi:Zn-dependent protease with chaperone function
VATKQRSRNRRNNSSRDRTPRYVAPVLDPNWQSPYIPSSEERRANLRAVRTFARRKKMPQTIIVAVIAVLLIVGFVIVAWLPAVGVVLAALYAWDLHRSDARFERRGLTLGATMLDQFHAGGTNEDRQRLAIVIDRLSATFGVDSVSALIVEESGYNAALVPNGAKYSLFVTNSLMSDFELIELEGVVAHCLARERLGLLTRESVASAISMNDEVRRALAGTGTAYRADEVAAAAIRSPLGLAGALRKCAGQELATTSYFRGSSYAESRWIWFNIWSDRPHSDLSDLDDAELRALALEEW